MPDFIDRAIEIEPHLMVAAIAATRMAIAPGVAGECDGCGERMRGWFAAGAAIAVMGGR